jgi:hypothetical protein
MVSIKLKVMPTVIACALVLIVSLSAPFAALLCVLCG